VKLSGATVPARARFVAETLLSATLSSLTLGLVCGQVGALCSDVGPLVPFLVGSWTGYTFGLVSQWWHSKRTVLHYAEKYPQLLRHSLVEDAYVKDVPKITSSDSGNSGQNLKQWILDGGIGRMSWSILAAGNCHGSVEELIEKERQRMVDEHHESHCSGSNGHEADDE